MTDMSELWELEEIEQELNAGEDDEK